MSYDYSKITERLFIGAQINSRDDIQELVTSGVTHIVDAQAERDDTSLVHLNSGMTVCWDPTQDDGQHPKPVEWTKVAVEFGIAALSQKGTIVLTHCAAGVNRGPSLGYAILRAQGWSALDVVGIIKNKRPQVGMAYRQDCESALQQLGWVK